MTSELILSPAQQLASIIAIAAAAHADQFDKGGAPYILHPAKVAAQLRTQDYELAAIAWGHDLFEDTVVTPEVLRIAGISERIILGIQCLTKVKGESEAQYKARVKSNIDAVKVKRSDLRHNSDIRRLKGITEKDIARTARYQEFYLELTEILNRLD